MFKIESYVTPILLSYVDKYVRDFKPADAQVSLWGGGVALHNLVLKADVLQNEVALPFKLVSGRIHELLIQVPWTKIMSDPIVVTIDTIECIFCPDLPTAADENVQEDLPSKTQVVEAPPGYMQALVRRIVNNISLRVHHLIVKYVQDDVVLSLNVKHLSVDSAGPDWEAAFADIDQSEPLIRRLVRLDDLTLCLDRADSDGKIRYYQEPLLYRCQLNLRVWTRLVSASSRRASNLSIQLRSSKLAWGVTNEQLALLIRLLDERRHMQARAPPPPPKPAAAPPPTNNAEPARSGSWSEWAWSWVPSFMDSDGLEAAAQAAVPTPVYFSAFLDHVSLVFKMMETDSSNRKRARGVLEVRASHAAARAVSCAPTALRVRAGIRRLRIQSHGKCVCGRQDVTYDIEEPTVYLGKRDNKPEDDEVDENWTWPYEVFEDKVELAEAAEEEDLPEELQTEEVQLPTPSQDAPENASSTTQLQSVINVQMVTVANTIQQEPGPSQKEATETPEPRPIDDDIWNFLNPIFYLEYTHVRSPPNTFTNPYENPPTDFEFSDWEEEDRLKISILPLDIRLSIGLIHRLSVLRTIFQDTGSAPVQEIPTRTLTVEECEALNENLPQRRITIDVKGFRLRMIPWDHSLSEKIIPIYLDVDVPHIKVVVTGALYSHRVCSAACQLPKDEGPLWQGARMHISATLASITVSLSSSVNAVSRPVARADFRFVLHLLQHREMFNKRDSITHGYTVKIHEINACGSAARIQAAWHVLESLVMQHSPVPLRHTTLAADALSDEEAVAIDATIEEITLRGFITRNMNTHNCMIQSMRVMAFYLPKEGKLSQAWLFSAPNAPTPTPFLRIAGQLSDAQCEEALDYLGCWTAPVAASVDPLLIAWLAYKPQAKPTMSETFIPGVKSSTLSYLRRRNTPPSSSGRGGSRTGSGSELVHSVRHRSTGSSSDRRPSAAPHPAKTADTDVAPEFVLQLHTRLQKMLLNVELAHTVVYYTASSASALDCATLTDAMERHAASAHHVLAFSTGFITVCSNAAMKHLWNGVKNDGPTYRTEPAQKPKKHGSMEQAESFPWKFCLSEVTCYTLEASSMVDPGREKFGLRSQLKNTGALHIRTVLEPVTTTVTLSVITKTMAIRSWVKQDKPKVAGPTPEELRVKYFTTGPDFKPSTLKEFVRGPTKRRKPSNDPPPKEFKAHELMEQTTLGPVVSIGIHLHADTPPVMVKLEQDQVHTVAAGVHCFHHLLILLNRSPVVSCRQNTSTGSLRSLSELDEVQTRESDENLSESRSDLVPILEYHATPQVKLKKFLWFQWVMGGATLVVSTLEVKLVFAADDIICTIDLQEHYDQFKMKIASASVRHNQKNSNDDWEGGVLGGRVLEAREPTSGMEEDHFLSVTITQAQISNLPESWKEELHPKLLQQKSSSDNMWEIYATLAPLEAVIQPAILENILTLAHQMAPPSFCPLSVETQQSTWQWPFCYVSAGGLRLLITTLHRNDIDDDTFILNVGKISISPYPENPICRRIVNSAMEGSWSASGGLEGHQYEVFVQSVAIQSTVFCQIALQEANLIHNMNTANENPAVKWTQPNMSAIVTTILHPVEVNCVWAPALYYNKLLACGPGLELNLASDCSIDISLEQLTLFHQIIADAKEALVLSIESCVNLVNPVEQVCPYARILKPDTETSNIGFESASTLKEDAMSQTVGCDRSFAADSGVDMNISKYINPSEFLSSSKKTVLILSGEEKVDPSDYAEIFVTMGTIDITLYVGDDDSPEVAALRPPWNVNDEKQSTSEMSNTNQPVMMHGRTASLGSDASRSLTETVRHADVGQTKLELNKFKRRCEDNVPLIHVTLYQPNMYYYNKKTQSNVQISLFNAWIGLGGRPNPGKWSEQLLSTAKGVADPVTDIPPALATVKIAVPLNAPPPTSVKGTVNVEIERPVLIELSADRLRRLKLVAELMESRLRSNENVDMDDEDDDVDLPFLYRLRKYMVDRSVESITVAMSQLGISGYDGTAGWDSVSLQVAAGHRPDRLSARGLVTALLVAAGPPSDCRHVVLQPVMLGMELEATWEAWRRVEAGMSACEPSVHMTVDFDRVTLDVRPSDLATLGRIQRMLRKSFGVQKSSAAESSFDSIHSAGMDDSVCKPINLTKGTSASFIGNMNELEDHFYKDDLKSGAFKIITGSQFPMAYQVTLHGGTVTWRYPHPRTITRIVLFPIPGVYEEVSCVLELYSFLLKQWMPHTCFKLPVVEPREYKLYVAPPDAVFATSWRVRVVKNSDEDETPFEFNIEHYMPREDPMSMERSTETLSTEEGVSAEQLSSALRVDSYFAPRLYPRLRVTLRFTEFQLNAHNSLPFLSSQSTALEGYYVSRPLMRAHRVLSVTAGDFAAHAHLGSGAGRLLLLDTRLSCDVMDCTTGALQQAVSSTRLRAALSATGALGPRARAFLEPVRVALHVPRLRTLTSLYDDWTAELEQYNEDTRSSVGSEEVGKSALRSRAAVQEATAATLEGRVSLWLHNSCASALRVGQEGTDEVVPLGPGARLAYRWRFPTAPMQLRFALAGPSTDWHWSASIPFTSGVNRIRLEDAEELGSARTPGGGVFLHARVEVRGAHRALTLAGRLVLANVLRQPLLYKVRARCADSKTWRSVCSGELKAESVGRSVLCGADCDMVLKIKFASNDTGWSGDIPLKECPKENVPWLVKVPSEGDTAYISVWCRVVRARSDGRVLAAVWPLYVLYSHLPLDTDVLVTTETELSSPDLTQPQARPTPLVQTTPGRGASTHLLAPGTTAARHQLSFQYKDIEYPVTRESIPLHYGVTDTSVFDKRAPVNNIEDVVADIRAWFDRSGHEIASSWPYSVVSSHWYGIWTAAKMQPRCEVTVRYGAVRAGGGCSLEIQLSPVVLLCNAAPLSLTLRAHDAAPLCRLEPGAAIAAPTAVLRKPFFMSVEIGRETFVSSQLQLWTEEPGRYGSPPRGFVALDHAAPFAIQCNHRVALLTLYYEIKHEINVLGVTTTFMIINRLNSNVLVSAIAVPCEVLKESTLEPKSFKVIPQTKEGSMEGEPLPRFYVPGRWRGGDPSELRAFLCLALPAGAHAARRPAPVRLGLPPFRRALHLLDEHNNSVPVVVVQQKHEGRWIVTVSPDPCPQFVVHNRTSLPLAVGEPARAGDDDHSAPQRMQAIQECAGASWWCQVAAGAMAHYSTPSHNARFPPAPGAPPPADPYIIVGCVDGLEEPDWGTSVAAAAASGEQLLQLPGGDMIKLRVHPHPHSTLLELQDVEENDISASDIRRRLQGSQSTQNNIPVHQRDLTSSSRKRSLIAEHVESLILPESERKHGTDVVTSAEVVSSVTEKSKVRLVLLPDKEEPIVEPNEETETDPTNVPPQETKSANLPPQETEQSDVSPQERAPSETKDELEPKAKDKSDEDVVRLTQTRKSENLLLSSKMSVHSNHKTISSAGVKKSSVLTQHSKHSKVTVSIADENKTSVTSQDPKTGDTVAEEHENQDVDDVSYYKKSATLADDGSFQNPSEVFDSVPESDWENNEIWTSTERLRCVISGIAIEMAEAADVAPLLALHVDRAAVVVHSDHRGTRGVLSIADVQVDNLQYSSGQYDFGVVATTRAAPLARDACPPLWSALTARGALDSRHHDARLLLRLRRERWRVAATTFTELSEVELSVGPLALYAEDSYATALAQLARALRTPPTAPPALAEWRALQRPLRLRELHVHPLDLTLTLHTAVRMYIALDQSPLRLSEFRLQDMMTSAEHLTHALTVHYLSAAILGAGWVVGGLELLGAPGALAARVGGATGGVRGVAAAAAAALLRSLSAWAGSLARNLDLLAGDEEHARRAAAARRRAPDSLVAGLAAGITNFAINILGAVGGLAHHPLVSVAVGEAESGATALRRGLLGALAKPLSATADLVAFAGTGLLRQTGWDPVPQPRRSEGELDGASAGWRRDCVRWAFRLAELSATAGFDALLDGAPLRLLLTHKFLVVADPETERIVEMIDFRFCTLGPYQGSIVELIVSQRRQKERQPDSRVTGEDDEYQISAAAMARVARYTGAGGAASEARVLALLPPPRRSPALHAALAAAVHNNSDAHLRLL